MRWLVTALLLISNISLGQDSTQLDKLISLPGNVFARLDKEAKHLEGRLTRHNPKYLSRLQKEEAKLKRKLWRKDSTLAKELFAGASEKYAAVEAYAGEGGKLNSVYSSRLDSLSTAIKFLEQNIEIPPSARQLLDRYGRIQSSLNAAEYARKFAVQRRETLMRELERLGMVKELKQFRSQVYYYQSQLQACKEMIDDPSKVEEKLMGIIRDLPQFQQFFARNSALASLFGLPASYSVSTGPPGAFGGLQTRESLNQFITARFGQGADVSRQIQENMQAAQNQLGELKSRLSSYSSGSVGNGGADLPEGMRPNSQKTKTFLERLEYGANFQSQKARHFFPVTSDIGLSLGYKLNDRSVIGVGASYKIGWGSGWNSIRVTHQGVGLRSYLDWRIRGDFFIAGGYEKNYRSIIRSIDQLKDGYAWQNSGLLGLSRKYALSKKIKGEIRLLWDFLSYRQVPVAQPILFRLGYSFK